MDGWVTVGTGLDTTQLEDDLKNAEKDLNKFQKEEEKLTKAKAKIDLSEYDAEKQKIKKSTSAMLEKTSTQEQINNVLSLEKSELKSLEEKYSKQLEQVKEINSKLQA